MSKNLFCHNKEILIKINPLIEQNFQFLRTLARSRSEIKRKQILKKATSQELLSLVEIALNVVRSVFQLTTRQKKRLLPYANFVRRLSRLRSERGARKILVQQGSGLPYLLPALLTPIIIQLAKVLEGKNNSNKENTN